jgi:hypothetical protein
MIAVGKGRKKKHGRRKEVGQEENEMIMMK